MKIQLISKRALQLFVVLLVSNNAFSRDFDSKEKIVFENEFRFFIEGSLHSGGDDTRNMPFYNRNTDTFVTYETGIASIGSYSGNASDYAYLDVIEAGGFFRGSMGAEFPVADQLSFSTSIGYLTDEITGDLMNGSVGKGYASYNRTIIDFIGFYMYERHRIGLGGSFHYNPKFDYKEVGENFQLHSVYRFSNAIGAVIQYDYLLSKNISMGIRYTDIAYDFEEVQVGDYVAGVGENFVAACVTDCEELVDASSISAHVTYRF